MQNIKLDETGRRLTNYECHVAFYDFSKIQGKFLGTLIKAMGWSNITHVAPIITLKNGKEITFTICEAKRTVNGNIIPNCKQHEPKELEKLGAILVDKVNVGSVALDLSNVIETCKWYSDNTAWDITFHSFIGRWIGLTRPRACSSMVCRLFGLPDVWHPATLYRKLKK